jgi:hypothetical protein
MAALGILGVSLLGLTAAMIIAFGSNGRSSRRTQMVEFAQSRLDRLSAATKLNICVGASLVPGVPTTSPGIDCSKMTVSGTFNPNGAPGTGGWVMDNLDRGSLVPAATGGIDQMAGPVLVLGDVGGAVDEAATVVARTNIIGDPLGCASTAVAKNTLCRELHIEMDSTSVYYHVWVRVVRGQNYQDGPVVLEGMIAR